MVGINDLLRMGRSADDVMSGLGQIYDAALGAGSNVLAIPPMAAPGFVSRCVLASRACLVCASVDAAVCLHARDDGCSCSIKRLQVMQA